MRCPKCGHDNGSEERFCVECGTPLLEGTTEQAAGQPSEAPVPQGDHEAGPSERTCPACGAVVDSEDRFCPACGADLGPADGDGAATGSLGDGEDQRETCDQPADGAQPVQPEAGKTPSDGEGAASQSVPANGEEAVEAVGESCAGEPAMAASGSEAETPDQDHGAGDAEAHEGEGKEDAAGVPGAGATEEAEKAGTPAEPSGEPPASELVPATEAEIREGEPASEGEVPAEAEPVPAETAPAEGEPTSAEDSSASTEPVGSDVGEVGLDSGTDGEKAEPPAPRYAAFCPQCGLPNRQNARFCGNCGTDLTMGEGAGGPEADKTVIRVPPVPSQARAAAEGDAPEKPGAEAGGRAAGKGIPERWRIPLIVLACVAAVALVVGGVAWKAEADRQAQEQAAYEQAHQPVDVGLTIEAPNYTADATRIPLRVEGTDLDGNAVDQVQYVSPDSAALSLLQGDYRVSVQASPLLGDGSLYVVPDTVVSLSVHSDQPQGDAVGDGSSEGGQGAAEGSSDGSASTEGAGSDTAAGQTIAFTLADPTQVTDDMIAAAKEAAEGDDQSADRAEALAQKATQARDDAVAQKKAAEEEAARQAKIQKVKDNALGFVKAYFTNTTIGNLVSDGSSSYYETSYIEDWQSRALKYVAKGSPAYSSLLSEEIGSLGYVDAWLVCKQATVTKADEENATVEVAYLGGNGEPVPGQALESETVYLSFDGDGLVTDVRFG